MNNPILNEVYLINSPVDYLTLSSEPFSEAQRKEYIRKDDNPKFLCRLNNDQNVRIIDNSLPVFVKVIVWCNNKEEYLEGYINKCVDGYRTLKLIDYYE